MGAVSSSSMRVVGSATDCGDAVARQRYAQCLRASEHPPWSRRWSQCALGSPPWRSGCRYTSRHCSPRRPRRGPRRHTGLLDLVPEGSNGVGRSIHAGLLAGGQGATHHRRPPSRHIVDAAVSRHPRCRSPRKKAHRRGWQCHPHGDVADAGGDGVRLSQCSRVDRTGGSSLVCALDQAWAVCSCYRWPHPFSPSRSSPGREGHTLWRRRRSAAATWVPGGYARGVRGVHSSAGRCQLLLLLLLWPQNTRVAVESGWCPGGLRSRVAPAHHASPGGDRGGLRR